MFFCVCNCSLDAHTVTSPSEQSSEKVSTPEKISDRLKRVRREQGLTQEQLAVALGFTRSYVSQLEAGIKEPGDRFVRDLDRLEAGALDVPAYPLSTLRSAREQSGFSVVQAAKRLGIDVGVYQAIENGDGKASERLIDKLCKLWPQLDRDALMGRSDHPNHVTDAAGRYGVVGQKPDLQLPPGVTARYVPLISWAQAGTLASFSDEAYQYDAHLAFNVTDRRAIAVEIRGDSMAPQYGEGDVVILYPSHEPRNGDLVIARLTPAQGEDVMFKIFNTTHGGRRIVLTSYNPAFPPLEYERTDFAWIYPAASVVKNLRK